MATTTTLHMVSFAQQQPGLLVTSELKKAIDDCTKEVERISRDCRSKNRKFRDIDFDLENDKNRCLYGIFRRSGDSFSPADVHRVTQIFDNPQFFVGGEPDANDIVQGALGDCWFLSALATVSNVRELVKLFCVKRDEAVGVYGFIFFRDNAWVTVVIDDLLFTRVPKYEELTSEEQQLYHYDKERYNISARRGGKTLYFASSGSLGETWVPLIEKAYAKLHGNYSFLNGGQTCEAVEDLTGGVSSFLQTKDILDIDRFWKEELLNANKDRLFACSFDELDTTRNKKYDIRVQGLIGNHAYSVLRAVECKGNKFVVVRNPWGKVEWTGPWSDGSKEWTKEWLEVLDELGHVFGDDGQFVMEYKDWLESFSQIDRTVLFDDTWIMSSQWLRVPCRPLPTACSYGDVSFTFTLPSPTLTVIVLSQLDQRYFRDISSRSDWTFDFILVKAGQKEPVAQSVHAKFWNRSVNLEIELEEGTYFVYVRIDREYDTSKDVNAVIDDWQLRKLSMMYMERTKSRSIASNFDQKAHANYIPTPLESLIETDFDKFEKEEEEKVKKEEEEKAKKEEETKVSVDNERNVAKEDTETEDEAEGSDEETVTTTTTTVVTTVKKKRKQELAPTPPSPASTAGASSTNEHDLKQTQDPKHRAPNMVFSSSRSRNDDLEKNIPDPKHPHKTNEFLYTTIVPTVDISTDPTKYTIIPDDENAVYLGLRVYTHKDAPVVVVGRLKAEKESDSQPTTNVTSDKEDTKGSGDSGIAVLVPIVPVPDAPCQCDECSGRQAHPIT